MNERQMMHGIDWNGEDVTGWLATEKMNGCRVFWDGAELWTRGGISVKLPDDWRAALPTVALDCEIYDGIDGLSRCSVAVRLGRILPYMRLYIHDVPAEAGGYAERMATAHQLAHQHPILTALDVIECQSNAHARGMMYQIQRGGGEGLVVRHPSIHYKPGRYREILKIK